MRPLVSLHFILVLVNPSKNGRPEKANEYIKHDSIKHDTSNIKGEVQSRIIIISKERVKISLQIGAKIMKIG